MKLKSATARAGISVLAGILCIFTLSTIAQNAPQAVWAVAGHSSTVTEVAVSADGAVVASASFDRTIKLWRASDGALLRILSGHSAEVKSISFSKDGVYLASGSYDKTVKVWRVADGSLVQNFVGHTDTVRSVAFSPDGSLVASGSQDKTVNLWRASDGLLVRSLAANANWVMSVAFSPDGSKVASGGADRTISQWRVSDGALVSRYTAHNDWVMSVAYSPNGASIASASVDFTVKLWDAASGMLNRTISGFGDAVNWVSYSADGNSLVTADWARVIGVRNVADGSLVRSFQEVPLVGSVQLTPDGQSIAYGRADGVVVLASNSGSAPVATPSLDTLAGTEKPSYVNKEKAKILVSVTDGSLPVVGASVSTTVTSSKNVKTVLSGTTGANGVAVLYFTVNSKQGVGTYGILTTATKTGYKPDVDDCSFTVTR